MTFLAVTVSAFRETCTVSVDEASPDNESELDELVGANARTWRLRPGAHFGLGYPWADSKTSAPYLHGYAVCNLFLDGRVIVAITGDADTALQFRQASYDRGLFDLDETLDFAKSELPGLVQGLPPVCIVLAGFSRLRGRAEAYQFFAPSYQPVSLGEGHHIFPRPPEDGFNSLAFLTKWRADELAAQQPGRARPYHRETFERTLHAWRAGRCSKATSFSSKFVSAEVSSRGAYLLSGPERFGALSKLRKVVGRVRWRRSANARS